MARITMENLVSGMRLNKPVCSPHGVLLLKAGEILTEKHLKILKSWGFCEADVVLEPGGEASGASEVALSPEVMNAAQGEINHRFRRARPDSDPVMAEILRVIAVRLVERQSRLPGAAAHSDGSGLLRGDNQAVEENQQCPRE